MHTPARLRKVLLTLPRITIHGLWSRAIGFDLLKGPPPGAPVGSLPQPLWPGGSALSGARFTPKGGFNSLYLYLADDPVTALHEVVSVFSPRMGPPVTIKTSPWVVAAVDGVLFNVVDLTEPAGYISIESLNRHHFLVCNEVLQHLHPTVAPEDGENGVTPTNKTLAQQQDGRRRGLGFRYRRELLLA
jgi:hypothetical protein